MTNRKQEIDRAWRKARRVAFFDDLRRSKFGIAVVLAFVLLIVGFFIFGAAQPRFRENVLGYGVTDFSQPSDSGPETRRVTVRLEDGRIVAFRFPKSEVFRKDVAMKVAIYERTWGPMRFEFHRFAGYAEAADQ